MPSPTVHVEGLRELQRAFKAADARLQRELRSTLREVAEPVRADAERLASGNIPTAGAWAQMKTGATGTAVYIAPKQRGRKHKRPNFGRMLLGLAMVPAVERNEPRVVKGLEDWLDAIGRDWEH